MRTKWGGKLLYAHVLSSVGMKPLLLRQLVNPFWPTDHWGCLSWCGLHAMRSLMSPVCCCCCFVLHISQLHDTTLEKHSEPPYHAAVVLVDPSSAQSIEDALDAQEQLSAATPILFVGVGVQSARGGDVSFLLLALVLSCSQNLQPADQNDKFSLC